MTHVDFCCGLLLRNFAAGLLLHVSHGLLLSCATKIWIATCSNLCNKLRKTLSADWPVVVCLLFALTGLWCGLYFSRCSIHRQVQLLRLRLIAFFLRSLTKAPDNNTPAIKIHNRLRYLKPCLLRVLLQLHFGVVSDRFLLLQQVAQQKSAAKVYVCHRVTFIVPQGP